MRRTVLFALGVALFSLFCATTGFAAPIAAKAVFVEGEAKLFPLDGGPVMGIAVGTTFRTGDRIRTTSSGVVEVELDTGSLIRIDRNTSMTIKALERDRDGSTHSIFGLLFGRVRSAVTRLSTRLSQFEYHTKAAICGVAGTGWVTEYNLRDNSISVDVFKKSTTDMTSRVFMQGTDPAKTVRWINAGESLSARFGRKPGIPRKTPASRIRRLRRTIPFSSPEPHEVAGSSIGGGATSEPKEEPKPDEPKTPTGASGEQADSGADGGEGRYDDPQVSHSPTGRRGGHASIAENVSINQIAKKISKPRVTDPGQIQTVAGIDNQGTQNQSIIGETITSGGDVTPPVTSATINVHIKLK